jgi:hypothetical protein
MFQHLFGYFIYMTFDDYHLLGNDTVWLPEDDNHHSHRRGNLKSYMTFVFYVGLYLIVDPSIPSVVILLT